jgi:hypothetical protein
MGEGLKMAAEEQEIGKTQKIDHLLKRAVDEISQHHRKIIDDWCKAYMAQLYQENQSIKPGDFVLMEQVPTIHGSTNLLVKKYWFEKRSDV